MPAKTPEPLPASLRQGTSAPRGPSIYQQFLNVFDNTVWSLMTESLSDSERLQMAGSCAGMSMLIAIMENPYAPNIDVVKRKAMERYEQRKAREART